MAKIVEFKNTSGVELKAEFGRFNEDDLTDGTPKVFDNDFNDHAKFVLFDMYVMMFPNGDTTQKPIFFFRHANNDKYRFGGFVELGDTYLSVQKGGHYEDLAQTETPMDPYKKISDDPLEYGLGTKEPFSEYRYYVNHSTWKEGDFFEATAKPWPITIYDHQSVYPDLSEIWQPACITGTYEGQPFSGLGGYDSVFMRQNVNKDTGSGLGYFYINMMGVREDGRREQTIMNFEQSGKIFAYYWIDGEEPILSDQATMEADFVHLPYVDDGTCVYKDAIFRFCGKEFHFEGKWGSKGFTGGRPRIERHGQSQVFGTWYEGKTPYKHKLFLTFNEQMEAYDHKLKKLGFDVID